MEILWARCRNVTSLELKHGSPDSGRYPRKAKSDGVSKGRTVAGIASVFGNVDSYSDIVTRGAFSKAIDEFRSGRTRARFLWGHDITAPPIAEILELKELSRGELPPSIRAASPDATGGLLVRRRYFTDDFSDRVYQGVKSSAISEMSFAFNTEGFELEDIGAGRVVRHITSLSLLDVSDVLWGANDATVASVGKDGRPVIVNARSIEAAQKSLANRQAMQRCRAEMRCFERTHAGSFPIARREIEAEQRKLLDRANLILNRQALVEMRASV